MNDGSFLVAGSSFSGISGDKTEAQKGGLRNYWIVKIDSKGKKDWDKVIGGNIDDVASGIVVTQDGNFVVLGTSKSSTSSSYLNTNDNKVVNTVSDKSEINKGGTDYWLVKLGFQ
jgi:hypothetical protein